MKKRKYIVFLGILMVVGIFFQTTFPIVKISAAGVSLSVSGTAEVGSTISVSINTNGGPFSGADGSFSYDGSVLELVSLSRGNFDAGNFEPNGAGFIVYNANIGGSIAVASFKCLKAGDTTVSVSIADMATMDGVPLGSFSASTGISITTPVVKSSNANLSSLTVSVGNLYPAFTKDMTAYSLSVPKEQTSIAVSASPEDAKATVSTNGVQNDLKEGVNTIRITVTAENGTQKNYTITVTRDAGPTSTPTPTPEPLPPVKINNRDYTIQEVGVDSIPEGFVKSTIQYEGREIPILVKIGSLAETEGALILIYLSDGEKAGFYVYNAKANQFFPYVTYLAPSLSYVILDGMSVENIPIGYELFTYVLLEKEISAFRRIDDPENELILLYLLDAEGAKSYFYYDSLTGLVMPFRGSLTVPTPVPTEPATTEAKVTEETTESTSVTTSEPTTSIEKAQPFLLDFQNPSTLIFYGVLFLFVAALLIFIVFFTRRRRAKKEAVNVFEDVYERKVSEQRAEPTASYMPPPPRTDFFDEYQAPTSGKKAPTEKKPESPPVQNAPSNQVEELPPVAPVLPVQELLSVPEDPVIALSFPEIGKGENIPLTSNEKLEPEVISTENTESPPLTFFDPDYDPLDDN